MSGAGAAAQYELITKDADDAKTPPVVGGRRCKLTDPKWLVVD